MKRFFIIIFSVSSIITVFIFLSTAILSIKMLELKNRLAKSQILNYEFSSLALKTKFKDLLGNPENYQKEIQSNILESGIINGKKIEARYSLEWHEYIGLGVVNIIRKLSLKSFLNFIDDNEYIKLLHNAFLLERNQRFSQASRKYQELEKNVQADDRAFVYLHSAYCRAVIGDNKEAVEKLKYVISNYTGTHFAENAEILLTILKESELTTKEILANLKDPHELARALFNTGRYKEAIAEFSKLTDLSDSEKYLKARALEKIGKLQEAIGDYYFLTEHSKDIQVVKDANRRLLMLGRIYDAGENLSRIAEKKAIELKDEQFAETVKEGADLKLKPAVFETNERPGDVTGKESVSSAKEMEVSLPARMVSKTEKMQKIHPEKQRFISSDKNIRNKQDNLPAPPPPEIKIKAKRLDIRLSDGRAIKGKSIKITGSEISVETKSYKMTFPYSMFEKVSIEGNESELLEYRVNGNSIDQAELIEKKEDEIWISKKGKKISIPAEKLGEVRLAE